MPKFRKLIDDEMSYIKKMLLTHPPLDKQDDLDRAALLLIIDFLESDKERLAAMFSLLTMMMARNELIRDATMHVVASSMALSQINEIKEKLESAKNN